MSEPTTYDLTFQPFAKMARYSRECIVTEKLDGTNAQIYILPENEYLAAGLTRAHPDPIPAAKVNGFVLIAGSRTRWIRPKQPGEKGDPDNYGFAAWVRDHAEDLVNLGPGKHFGEWFGSGINRAYGMTTRKFALFNVSRWIPYTTDNGVEAAPTTDGSPAFGTGRVQCCTVVPTIYRGEFCESAIVHSLALLRNAGSLMVSGFRNPEGIVIFHTASGTLFKKTIEGDESPKSLRGPLSEALAQCPKVTPPLQHGFA